jgi:hypothetical protein
MSERAIFYFRYHKFAQILVKIYRIAPPQTPLKKLTTPHQFPTVGRRGVAPHPDPTHSAQSASPPNALAFRLRKIRLYTAVWEHFVQPTPDPVT